MARSRVILFFLLVGSIIYFLINKENWKDDVQLLFAGWIVICAGLFFFGPKGKSKKYVQKTTNLVSEESIAEELISEEIEEDDEIPEPIVSKNQDAKTLRELKLAKIANKKAIAQAELEEEELNLEEEEIEVVEVIEEESEYHVASEYVVDVNADSIEDIEIVNAVGQRRSVHDRIRKRIEERRRNQMAEIRASKARMWNEKDKREDLTAILASNDHGLVVLSEPEKVTPGRPYGATYVRIDENKVLKFRFALDDGFRKIDSNVQEKLELPGLPPLPLLDGSLPPLEGLPPLDLADLPPLPSLD